MYICFNNLFFGACSAFFLADFEEQRPMMTYMMDKGMIDRFFPEDMPFLTSFQRFIESINPMVYIVTQVATWPLSHKSSQPVAAIPVCLMI